VSTPTTSASFHAGLSAKAVVDAAWELSCESHLLAWSLRGLAGRLGVAPSVIYHHVGGKDEVCRRVVERVLTDIDVPEPSDDWEQWFRDLLWGLYPLVTGVPGVAKWTLMHGPTVPSMIPTLARGLGVLKRGGFGDRVSFAYVALLNTAMLTISVGDDRLRHEGDGPRDHASMMEEFDALVTDAEELRDMRDTFMLPFARGGEDAGRMREQAYRAMIDVTIAGLASQLPASG